jgi:death-on-curing protein
VTRDEPVWLSREEVAYLHDSSIRQFGGSPGVRDEGLIASAIARPTNLWSYEPDADLAALAAAYAFGLAKNHGFIDGNKRIGFLAMGVFLYVNGWRLEAAEPEAVVVMVELASGRRSEQELAAWLRERIRPLAP